MGNPARYKLSLKERLVLAYGLTLVALLVIGLVLLAFFDLFLAFILGIGIMIFVMMFVT